MENDTSENKRAAERMDKPDSVEADKPAKRRSSAGAGKSAKKKSFARFLIDTEVMPLVLVGKSMDYFGSRAIVGLLLGAATVYAIALFRPLPYAAMPKNGPNVQPTPQATNPPPVEPNKIRLHGFVKDRDNKPISEPFVIAVLANQQGPIFASDGSFSIQVPQSNAYDIAVWNRSYSIVQVYTNYPAVPDGDGFSLGSIPFFSSVALGSDALLRTKRADPEMARSWQSNDRFNIESSRSE